MSNTFSLDPSEFGSQAATLVSAGDELTTALRRLQSAITTEGNCWGNDAPGQAFHKTYQPDADITVQNVQSLAATLSNTGAAVKQTAENLGNQDNNSSGDLTRPAPNNTAQNSGSPLTGPYTHGSSTGVGDTSPQSAADNTGANPPAGAQAAPGSSSAAPAFMNDTNFPGSASLNQPTGQGDPDAQGDSATPQAPTSAAIPGAENNSGRTGSGVSTTSAASPVAAADDPDAAAADESAQMSSAAAAGGSGDDERKPVSARPTPGSADSGEDDSAPRNGWSPGAMPRKNDKKRQDKNKRKVPTVTAPEAADQPPPTAPPLSAAEIRRSARPGAGPAGTPWSGRAPGPAAQDPHRG